MPAQVLTFTPAPRTDPSSPLVTSAGVAQHTPRVGFVTARAYAMPQVVVQHETERAVLLLDYETGVEVWCPKRSMRYSDEGMPLVMDWIVRRLGYDVPLPPRKARAKA